MILGIDFGSSTTDVVLMNKDKIVKSNSYSNKAKLKQILKDFPKVNYKATGCGSLKLKNKVDEIKAIGKGGSFVSKKKDAIIVSIGSGTCIVSKKGNKIKHIGGTAIGGRTLSGLSQLLLKTKNYDEIEKLASKGNLKDIDLNLNQIYPKGIGLLPNTATASHFGNVKKNKKEDIALALINMLAQTIGTLAVFAAKSEKQKNIILTGKVTKMKKFKDTIKTRINTLHKTKVLIPKNAEFATAIGATR